MSDSPEEHASLVTRDVHTLSAWLNTAPDLAQIAAVRSHLESGAIVEPDRAILRFMLGMLANAEDTYCPRSESPII
jgi:hypothetical protein